MAISDQNRFVVFHEYRCLAVWYVEASTDASAIERVHPSDPETILSFVDSGGVEDPELEAHVATLVLRAHPIRRFPPNVTIATGSTTSRRSGPAGEPPMSMRGRP